LRGEATVGLFLEQLAVKGTTVMGDQNDALQFVDADEEIELAPGGSTEVPASVPGHQPPGAARDCPAVIPGNEKAPVAEFVKGLAPPAVTAIESEGTDSVRVPPFATGKLGHGQVRAEFKTRPTKVRGG
jgi:hypothetical protein